MPEKLILQNKQAPGDLLMLTAAIRDLHRCYPGQFVTGLDISCTDIFRHNPYITNFGKNKKKIRTEKMHYPMIHQSNQSRLHFIQGFIQYMNVRWNRGITLTEAKPDVHLTPEEKKDRMIDHPYWVIASGGKGDFTAKWWDHHRWQEVVNQLKDVVRFVQVGAGKDNHPPLENVVDLRGQTTIRDLMKLIYHSDGVCCVVTCLMHFAAAFDKPCVVVAGGREPWWWEWYTNEGVGMGGCKVKVPHIYLQSMGKLDCCKKNGCWRNKILPTQPKKQSLCARPVKLKNGVTIPKCLEMISAQDVVSGVRMYLEDNMDQQVFDFGQRNAVMPEAQTEEILMESTPETPGIDTTVYDSKHFGGKVTICTLLYGDFHAIHKRNLLSIVNNTPKDRYELRIGCNEVCKKTMQWIRKKIVPVCDPVMYIHSDNPKKYPVMREMFHDEERPITTKWVVWFDDDSHAKDPMWLYYLAQSVNMHHPAGAKMYGKRFFIHLKNGQEDWIKKASWYRNKPLRIHKNLLRVDFITGGWWALEVDAMRKMDWPDLRICHNGGDVMCGAAMQQLGFQDKQHYTGIAISDADRRGYREAPAGSRKK